MEKDSFSIVALKMSLENGLMLLYLGCSAIFLLAILSFLLPKDLINLVNVKWRDDDFNITNVHSD